MDVRDAVERDAETLAAVADVPPDVVRNLVHDRTVRVAERRRSADDPNADAEALDAELLGFVSFDAREGSVHVTQFAGTPEALERLLSEPIRFAAGEGMDVQLLVDADDDDRREVAESVGFQKRGPGPMFDGKRTVRYGMTP